MLGLDGPGGAGKSVLCGQGGEAGDDVGPVGVGPEELRPLAPPAHAVVEGRRGVEAGRAGHGEENLAQRALHGNVPDDDGGALDPPHHDVVKGVRGIQAGLAGHGEESLAQRTLHGNVVSSTVPHSPLARRAPLRYKRSHVSSPRPVVPAPEGGAP